MYIYIYIYSYTYIQYRDRDRDRCIVLFFASCRLYSGDACEYSSRIGFWIGVAGGSATAVLCLFLFAFCCWRRYNKPGFRLEATYAPPVVSLDDGHKYHLFLSHVSLLFSFSF